MRALPLLAAAAPATGQRAALLATGIPAAPIVYFRGRAEVAPAPEGSPQLAAPGNWFSVNDEQKLLPEVMSKLTFETSDHAAPGDLEAEEALRTSAHWGRLYVEGWPASMQYLRGHFGEVAPRGTLPVLAADPPDLCSSLSDALVTLIREKPSIIVAMRGTCTFGTKATFLAEAAGHNASLAREPARAGARRPRGPGVHSHGRRVGGYCVAGGVKPDPIDRFVRPGELRGVLGDAADVGAVRAVRAGRCVICGE